MEDCHTNGENVVRGTMSKADTIEKSGLRVCLAASGGGHLRQLLDLQTAWEHHDYFFVTEDTALGRSLIDDHPVQFVAHFGFGQAKLGEAWKMLRGAIANFLGTLCLMLTRRPHVVISTGAGAVFFTALFGRLLGARVVAIESFARFEHASLFGRMIAPFAQEFVVQSGELARHYPRAKFFDPFLVLDSTPPPKRSLIFATVGAVLPFDRLVSAVSQLKIEGAIPEQLILQRGEGGRSPAGVETVETLPFGEIQNLLKSASIVICHGGTGSIITALREGCHVIAMPRLQSLGEVYDDHQAEIVQAFEKRGLIQSATNVEELRSALRIAPQRARIMATTRPTELVDFLSDTLATVAEKRRV